MKGNVRNEMNAERERETDRRTRTGRTCTVVVHVTHQSLNGCAYAYILTISQDNNDGTYSTYTTNGYI